MRRATRPTRLFLRAAGSAMLLAGFLVVPPVALARLIGWPLPHNLPTVGQIRDSLSGATVSDATLLDALACAVWVLWAVLVACAIAEVVAWARCREAWRLPGAGFLQPAVRELVVSAALLAGALRPAAASAVAEVPRLVSVATPAPPSSRQPSVAPAGPTCVVAPRDSLWKLAERHLGDGLRWRDIWELNRAARFPDGRRFTDPDLILPGWVLALPDDATGLAEPTPVVPSPVSPASQPVMPVGGGAGAPGATGPAPPASPESAPAARPGVSVSPGLALAPAPPAMTVPPAPANGPGRPSPVGAIPSGRTASAPTTAIAARPTPEDDPDHDPAPLLAASGLVAAGVIAALTRLRRRQQRHQRPGHMIRLPDGESARAEVHLRRAAVDAPFDRLDLALRALANCLGRRRAGSCPVISVLSAGPDAIEILLAEAVDAPAGPFEVTAEGRAWTLPSDVPDDDLRPLADVQSGPAPALVAVGVLDERTVLVDLEAGCCTLVGGDPDDARALLWSMAVDLATSNRADDIDLVLVGKPPAGLDALDRVRVVDSVGGLLEGLEASAWKLARELAQLRRASTFDARVTDPTLLLTPTVVLVADPADEDELAALLIAAGGGHGVAVVVSGVETALEFDRELCVEGDTLLLKPLGLRLQPAALPCEVAADVGELLATAADIGPGPEVERDLAPACHPPFDGLTIGPDRLPLTFDEAGQPVIPPGHVLVRIMGSVEIMGSERPIDRRRSVELVVYLALHPEGVDEGRIRAALWPEGEPSRGAFNETVSRARRMLGDDPTGEHHLRPVDNRRYRLGPYVVLDADVLSAVSDERMAAKLVRGLPFEGTGKGYEWAYQEGHAYRLSAMAESLLASAAHPAVRNPRQAPVHRSTPEVQCAIRPNHLP